MSIKIKRLTSLLLTALIFKGILILVKLNFKVTQKGLTLIPLKMYFKQSLVKKSQPFFFPNFIYFASLYSFTDIDIITL